MTACLFPIEKQKSKSSPTWIHCELSASMPWRGKYAYDRLPFTLSWNSHYTTPWQRTPLQSRSAYYYNDSVSLFSSGKLCLWVYISKNFSYLSLYWEVHVWTSISIRKYINNTVPPALLTHKIHVPPSQSPVEILNLRDSLFSLFFYPPSEKGKVVY